tara:strand:- start:29 stop:799 length:771 start_codon:yes stop_codon:yes gene_type:complete
MATNFLQLTNELLRRLNEVVLTTDNFATAKNVQALAKDAINSSIREILQDGHQFPFLKVAQSQTLTAGTGTYDFPSDMSTVDWDTFYLQKLTSESNTAKSLPVISFDFYTQKYRGIEDAAGEGGRSAPNIVYQTSEEKFGVTPIPNAAYIVDYVYYKFPNPLGKNAITDVATDGTDSTYDTPIIPERFNYIIIDGAMVYMMRFRSNEQSAQIHQGKFIQGIKTMRRILLDDALFVKSTTIARPKFSTHMLSISSGS